MGIYWKGLEWTVFIGCFGNQNKLWMLMWGFLGTFGVAVVPSLKPL